MAAVAPPRIHGEGRHEPAWRASPWLAALPLKSPREVLDGCRRLVLLSPHPDDETLACGGLMRAASGAAVDIHLVAVTDGEACYPGSAEWPAERLREVRPREVEQAFAVLGVRARVRRLGIPDGRISAHRPLLEAALRRLLRPGDLVLAPWEHDGHPDHDAVGHAALAAVRSPGIRLLRYPVWAWHWLETDTASHPFTAFRLPLDPDTAACKRRAIARFASQTETGEPGGPILPPHVLERFRRPFEVYLP